LGKEVQYEGIELRLHFERHSQAGILEDVELGIRNGGQELKCI
jgi:hypothetical protein